MKETIFCKNVAMENVAMQSKSDVTHSGNGRNSQELDFSIVNGGAS